MNDVGLVLLRLARAVERNDITPLELVEVFHAEFYGRQYVRKPLVVRAPARVPRDTRRRILVLRKRFRRGE